MARTLRRVAAFRAIWKAMTAKGGPSVGERLTALPRMFWYSATGRYDGIGRIVLIAAATAYVASPIDLLPEMVLLLPGLIDDAVVITWIAGAVLGETERFLAWEEGRTPGKQRSNGGPVIDGDVA
jgi:uncharacterized membrane protein YkvA (DUF1232 family)